MSLDVIILFQLRNFQILKLFEFAEHDTTEKTIFIFVQRGPIHRTHFEAFPDSVVVPKASCVPRLAHSGGIARMGLGVVLVGILLSTYFTARIKRFNLGQPKVLHRSSLEPYI
jgi:hypothetical protein